MAMLPPEAELRRAAEFALEFGVAVRLARGTSIHAQTSIW